MDCPVPLRNADGDEVPAEVRAAIARDARILAEVAAQTFPLACPSGTTAENIDSFIAANLSEARFEEYLRDPARTILVAVEGATTTGYSMLNFGEPEDVGVRIAVRLRPTVELGKFFIISASQGKGTAGRLMAASLEVAANRGNRSIWLGVGRQNARANRFYEKQGFVVVGTKAFRVGNRVFEHDIVRERPLSADAPRKASSRGLRMKRPQTMGLGW
jgi:ribosomal protein S18 acetylase RimI-like enzyme